MKALEIALEPEARAILASLCEVTGLTASELIDSSIFNYWTTPPCVSTQRKTIEPLSHDRTAKLQGIDSLGRHCRLGDGQPRVGLACMSLKIPTQTALRRII